MVHDFLSSEGLEERLVDGCMEKDLPYRRITGKDKNAYVWMEAKKYIDGRLILWKNIIKILPQ